MTESFLMEYVYKAFSSGDSPDQIAYELGISVEEVFKISNQIELEMEQAYAEYDSDIYYEIDGDYLRDQAKYGEL